jgi:hypothetical protein
VSIQGISKTQLDTLKARMEVTKGKLEQLQVDPGNTTALNGLTGDTITGDVLNANVWGWFADLQGHGRIASSQAMITTKNGTDSSGTLNNSNTTSGIYDQPGLQYGLFHANAQPNKLFGAVTTGISFRGVLMDIGHVRHNRWVKDDGLDVNNNNVGANATSDTRKRWIAYNRIRGQYASGLEHAVPERFFSDATKCNAPGISNPDLTKPTCTEGVSAVKAIAIALGQGQKVFTITSVNADQAISQLSHRMSVIDEVRASIATGKEVTIHERAITANGWSGAGYSVIDSDTGAGGYLIEGGANGGYYSTVANGGAALFVIALLAGKLALAGLIPAFALAIGIYLFILGALVLTAVLLAMAEGGYDPKCGGDPACESFEIITKIVAGTVAMVLLAAGLSGNLIALALAIFLLRQIFTRGGP